MARRIGGGLNDPAVFAKNLEGLRHYDAEENRAYVGTADNPGQVYDNIQKAIDVWRSVGVLDKEVKPADFVAHDVWD